MAGAEMKDALTGAHLTFVAADYGGNAHWYTVDATTGVASGFHVELMGIVAEKAGFTFDIERITSAEFSGHTWSDYLRLSVKYLVFDLEATRRENAYLRRLVEQANKERDHGNTDES